MSERTHYMAIVTCLNCGQKREVKVLCGMTVNEHIKGNHVVCSECKCNDARLVVKT